MIREDIKKLKNTTDKRMTEIEELLANSDLGQYETEDLGYEYDELLELSEVLNAYFKLEKRYKKSTTRNLHLRESLEEISACRKSVPTASGVLVTKLQNIAREALKDKT